MFDSALLFWRYRRWCHLYSQRCGSGSTVWTMHNSKIGNRVLISGVRIPSWPHSRKREERARAVTVGRFHNLNRGGAVKGKCQRSQKSPVKAGPFCFIRGIIWSYMNSTIVPCGITWVLFGFASGSGKVTAISPDSGFRLVLYSFLHCSIASSLVRILTSARNKRPGP